MTHPFVANKQECTIRPFDRGPHHPLWVVIDDTHINGQLGGASLFYDPYRIGDEVGLVAIDTPHGWALAGIKKTEIGTFLELYELAKGYTMSPRYVLKECQ